MKKTNIARLAMPGLAFMLLGAAACNDHTDKVVETYGNDTSVAITSFKLQANSQVLNRLDSVFFSIDLDNAVVFNADSLPKGTDITGLIPVIKYPESVSAAVITMDGEKRQGEIDYLKNPLDSVDFTGPVTLTLTAQDGETQRTYRLKVNVHQQLSDTLIWDNLAAANLPSRLGSPRMQKSVSRDGMVWTLLEEKDGSLTLASNASPGSRQWSTVTPELPEEVVIRSFTASDDSFYVLDNQGNLLASPDGVRWNETGEVWRSISGGYGDVVLGISSHGGQLMHVSYPANYQPVAAEDDFPVNGQSNMGILHSKWGSAPIAILAGGRTAEGDVTACVWGFDGFSWARISQDGTPALADATLIPYTLYRANSSLGNTEYSIWLLVGGYDVNGNLNRTVYMSYDNGVNWQPAVDYMQLPDIIPAFASADGVVLEEERQASLADYWKRKPSRKTGPWFMVYEQEGYMLKWRVPYIYLFGGYDANHKLYDTVWRGVLNRLTFTPLI